MPWGEPERRDFDSEELKGKHYITFREVREFGYVDAIAKVMRLKEPHKLHTLRTKDMSVPSRRRFIRDGTHGQNTDLEVEIINVEKIQYIKITEEFAKADIATNNPPLSGSYKRDLYHVLKTLHPGFFPSVLYINYLQPVIKNRQISLDGKILGRQAVL